MEEHHDDDSMLQVQNMVSNDVAVDGESVSIDPDIRRDWGPLLRVLPISLNRPKRHGTNVL
jgi:hypothetical protein